MKPTKNQINSDAFNKSQEYFNELLICYKMAKKCNNENYGNIQSKFWRKVAKLEKLTEEFPDILTGDQKLKLEQMKLKF